MSAKIVLVTGSSRVDSQSAKVAHYLAERLQARGAQCQVPDLGHAALPLPLWPSAEKVAAWPAMAAQLEEADALVLLSPEWHGLPGAEEFLPVRRA